MRRRVLLAVVAAWVLWERAETFHPEMVTTVHWAPVDAPKAAPSAGG